MSARALVRYSGPATGRVDLLIEDSGIGAPPVLSTTGNERIRHRGTGRILIVCSCDSDAGCPFFSRLANLPEVGGRIERGRSVRSPEPWHAPAADRIPHKP